MAKMGRNIGDASDIPKANTFSIQPDGTNITEYNSINNLTRTVMAAAVKPTPMDLSAIQALDEGAKYKYFVGQGGAYVGDVVAGEITYTGTETIFDYVNWLGVGSVLTGSTTYSGEDATSTDQKNEQGAVVYGSVTAGTFAMDLTLMSIADETLKRFVKAEVIEEVIKLGKIKGDYNAVGFGGEIPKTTQMFALANEDFSQIIIIPKAEITGSYTGNPGAEGALQLKLNVKAVTHDYKVPGTKKHLVYKTTLKTV